MTLPRIVRASSACQPFIERLTPVYCQPLLYYNELNSHWKFGKSPQKTCLTHLQRMFIRFCLKILHSIFRLILYDILLISLCE